MKRSRPIIIQVFLLLMLVFTSCSDDSSGPVDCTSCGGLSQAEAETIVKDTIIPQEVAPGEKYVCLGMDGSIPKGSTVEEAVPTGWTAGGRRGAHASFQVDAESYFYFLDLDPYSFYDHPVKYIVVNKSTGAHSVTGANWWPKINGSTPSQFLDKVPEASYVIGGTADQPAPVQEQMRFRLPDLGLIWKEGFIVIQGLMPDEKLYDEAVVTYENGLNFFNAYKNAFSRVEGLADVQADSFGVVIDDMVAEGIDLITLYIVAHGSVNRIGLAGRGVSVSSFKSKMAEHPDVLFNMVLLACHSGSFIDDLQTLDNVRVILTACASDESAWPDWDEAYGQSDYNPIDSGAEWTSSILWAAWVIANDSENFSIVEDWAGTYGVPETCELLYQAHRGAFGLNSPMDLILNLDLSYRTQQATPQMYHSWRRM